MAGFALQEILAGLDPNAKFSAPDPVAAPAPAHHGMNWGAILADALSGLAGQQGQYPQRVAKERAAQQEEVQWGRRREADLADYGRKLEMQNDPRYAKPASPHYFEDNAGNQWQIGSDGKPALVFTDKASKQYIQDGMLITVPNPYNTTLGAAPASPPSTIDENLWNTGKPVGGQASAPGGFHRPR